MKFEAIDVSAAQRVIFEQHAEEIDAAWTEWERAAMRARRRYRRRHRRARRSAR